MERKVYDRLCDLHITLAMDWPQCVRPILSIRKRQIVYRGLELDECQRLASEFKVGRINKDGQREAWHANYVCSAIYRRVSYCSGPIPPDKTDEQCVI